jgi:serine/threonine-protein kinase
VLEVPDQVAFEIAPGDVVEGKYLVERVLGRGGMGIVLAARHIQLDEMVALKFLRPEISRNADTAARFLREARAAARIKNEHVGRVTDVGQLENGLPYMVMEYLDGQDLSAWLTQHGRIASEQAVDFVLQACEAIADAHSYGIVHRDLKPANLFCISRSDGQLAIKVLDFGISKLVTPGTAAQTMTQSNTILGSPLYMSPEQLQPWQGVDARTDIWSLGVILYELVAGRTPFDSGVLTELAIKIAMQGAIPLRSVAPEAPVGLDAIISKCLEKDRNRRFQNVGELAVALRDYGTPGCRLSVERVLGTLRRASNSGEKEGPLTPSVGTTLRAATERQGVGTGNGWGNTGPEARRPSTRTIAGIGVGALAIGLTIYAGVALRRPSVGSMKSTATGVTEASADIPVLHVVASAESSVPTLEPEALDADFGVAVRPPATGPIATQVAPAHVHPHASSPAVAPLKSTLGVESAPQPSPKQDVNCDPPWFIDSAGHRRYKLQCLDWKAP